MNDARKDILIIDDSLLIADRLKMLIAALETVGDVYHKANSEDALAFLEQYSPHLIFLDINLGRSNGIVLLGQIRQKYPFIKVAMFTNNPNDYFKAVCEAYGADYFLDKSKDFELIPGIIKSL